MTETKKELLGPLEIANKIAGIDLSAFRLGYEKDYAVDNAIGNILANESPELINQLTPFRDSLFRGSSPQRLEGFVEDLKSSVFGETVGGREMIAYLYGRIDMARDLGRVKRDFNDSLQEIDRLTT